MVPALWEGFKAYYDNPDLNPMTVDIMVPEKNFYFCFCYNIVVYNCILSNYIYYDRPGLPSVLVREDSICIM